MACCGAGARVSRDGSRNRAPGALPWLRHRPGADWGARELAARPVCGALGCEVPRVAAVPPAACMGDGGCGGAGGCVDSCCKVERSAGNPPDTIAGLDRATWDRMGDADRRAWLDAYARQQGLSAAASAQLRAQALSGSFDVLRGVINTVRDIELERLRQRGATDRTRITGRNDAEVALLSRHTSNPTAFGHGGGGPVQSSPVATLALPMLLLAMLR